MGETPHILSVATAVPPHRLAQSQVKAWARRQFNGAAGKSPAITERLLEAFDNAGVETRYSCVPLEWYGAEHGWPEKNNLYLEHATALAHEAATACLAKAGVGADRVDSLITVSTSGIATPSLDARLMNRLAFRAEVRRLPVFGLGCAGGALGLGRAAEAARAEPGRLILLIVVELCGLTFRSADRSKSNVIATALFGDGAAAVLVSTGGTGPALTHWGEHTWPDTLSVMGWSVEDDGLGVIFSRDIPNLVESRFAEAAEAFLAARGLTLADLDGYICHPGGAKVVGALERVFGLQAGGLALTRRVLADYGNMSAASVLFVLAESLNHDAPGRYLLTALGPGFSAGFAVIEVA